ncbi:RHS repeat-associated core domain-containing protein [Vandammella animalimorsus]|uniref:RHS repeat-associated core domain-containing protein n=1 Tax=Vandammella animalimorsus TaxID=2029117 RepID=UPI00117846F8|nr:RHS repeat-associated core domain-containing protein [Vandammella animalimorsus]
MTTALCLWQAASAHAFLARADEIQATTHYQYSPTGQRTSQTSPEGRQTQYSYDSLGRLSQVTDPQGNTSGYHYNSQGQLLAQTDAEGKTTQYGYDRAGRRTQRTLADGANEALHYNALGQLTQKTHFDGSQTTWEYGAAASGNIPNPAWGQITREHRADGSSQTRGYDGHGRHTQSADTRDGTETRSLDALGRVTSSTIQHSAAQLSGSSAYQSRQNYQWDARGHRTQLHTPASGSNPEYRINASWDAAGQLQSLQASSDTSPSQFTHDGAGRLTHIQRSDGSSTSYQYTPDGHISQIRHQGSQGQTLAQFDYQHNRDGQRTQAKETIHSNGQTLQRTIDWTYDPAGKLTQEHIQQTQPTAQTLSIAYQYDKVGNRTSRTVTGAITQTTTYQYDANDRLTSQNDSIEGTTSYRYDQRGNLVEKANGNNKTAYSWNSDNRLIKVEHTGQNNKTIQYGYDPQGRRIKKLVQQGTSKTETHYSLDSERPYHEVVVESTRVNTQPWTHKTYVHTPGGVGELISQSDGTTTKQIYADAQGTTRLIADGNTSRSYSFDAFGNALQGDSLDNAPTHLYTGERYDADTGLIYLRARDYDPSTGRFISMDEHPGDQRIPLTLNKYLYANADPVNHVDPSGNITMGGMVSGIGNIASISLRAINFYGNFIDPIMDNDSEREGLWDIAMTVILGNGYGLANTVMSMMPSKQGSFIFGRVSGKGKLTNEHHTIPVYLCGAESKLIQKLAVIDAGLHDAIHAALDKVPAAVNIAGVVTDRLFNRKRAKINKPAIVRVAQKKMGRAVIANALRAFYEYYNLMGEGGYHSGTLNIGEAFNSYNTIFILNRSKTSYPRCSRR